MRPRPSPHDSIAITRAKQALNRISSRLLSPRARYVLARARWHLPSANYVVDAAVSERRTVSDARRAAHSHESGGPITVGYHDDGFTGPARVFCDFPTYPRVFPRNKCGVQRDGSPYFGSMFLAVTKLGGEFLSHLGALSGLGLPLKVGNRPRSGILHASQYPLGTHIFQRPCR